MKRLWTLYLVKPEEKSFSGRFEKFGKRRDG